MSARTHTSGRAPLAVRESFESKIEDFTELRDFQGYEKPMDLKLKPENVTQQEFYDMSRKQQNLKMYKVPDIFAIAGPGPCPVQVQSESVRESLRISENDKDLDQGIAL